MFERGTARGRESRGGEGTRNFAVTGASTLARTPANEAASHSTPVSPMMFKKCRQVFALLSLPLALAAAEPEVIPLWANGAPGFEDRRNEPELAQDYWVKNIHNPSVTVFLPPKEKATGAA